MKIKLINHGYDFPPKRCHVNDVGADVYARHSINLQPQETYAFPLGFGVLIPDGYAGYLDPRTSLSKKGIHCHHNPIDPGYTGEVHAILTNTSREAIMIYAGDRIAQLVVVPAIIAEFTEETFEERGDGAFGSTGV